MKRESYYGEPKANMVQLPQPDSAEMVPQQPEEQPLQSVEAEPDVIRNVDQSTTTENLPLEGYQEEEPPSESVEEHEDLTKVVEKEIYEKNIETPQEFSSTEEEGPNKEQNEQNNDGVDAGAVALEEPMETDEIEQPILEENHSSETEEPHQVKRNLESDLCFTFCLF